MFKACILYASLLPEEYMKQRCISRVHATGGSQQRALEYNLWKNRVRKGLAGSSVFTVSQLAQSTPSSNRGVMNTLTMGLVKTMPHRTIYRIYKKRTSENTVCGKKTI
jgi:hypothetical protein